VEKFKYIKLGGEEFVLEQDFKSKTDAKKYADRLRRRTKSSVRVVNRSGKWGVYSA